MQIRDQTKRQSISGGEGSEAIVFESNQSALVKPEPKITLLVLDERFSGFSLGQAVRLRKSEELLFVALQSIETKVLKLLRLLADPEIAARIFEKFVHFVSLKAIFAFISCNRPREVAGGKTIEFGSGQDPPFVCACQYRCARGPERPRIRRDLRMHCLKSLTIEAAQGKIAINEVQAAIRGFVDG